MELHEIQRSINRSDNLITIAVISNIILEPYFNVLIQSRFIDCKTNVVSINYDEYKLQENIDKFNKADYIVICLNFDQLYPNAFIDVALGKLTLESLLENVRKRWKDLYQYLKQQANASILWFGFEDYYYQYYNINGNIIWNDNLVDKLNNEIYCWLKKQDTYIDLKRLIASVSISNAYNLKGKYRWNAPYSRILIDAVVKEIHKQYLIEKGITKKCLILDCDNVLWGGILSEDGIENLKLSSNGIGRVYQDFQRFVLSLYCQGVILAVCSKNDMSDVLTMFRKHSGMILKEEHIACIHANWEDKPSNIKRISEKLNINLDSIVFVDDSPIEIEAVKAVMPDVTAILFKRDIEYKYFSCFNLRSDGNISDLEKRNGTYRTNGFREELKAKYTKHADYIKALEIKIDIHEALPIEYSRISELIQRTNKCSNGIRYTVSEIKEHVISDIIRLYSISVSDRFSDLGLVGAIEVNGNVLTLFSLSCRALGRDIENEMLNFIRERHQVNFIKYHSTGKNEAIKTLLVEAFPNASLASCENV